MLAHRKEGSRVMRGISISVFLIVLVLSTPGIGGAQRVTAGYVSKDLNYLPFFIGLKKGLYAKEGVQVDLVSIGRADIQLQALVAGELHFANINAKNIRKLEDLKGHRLGVASLTGGATSILLAYMKSKGFVYPRDFSLSIIAGGTPARLSALESNAIAGAVLGIPFADVAVDKGFSKLGDTMEVISTYQFNNININPTWAEKNRPAVVKFIKGHIQALRWIYDHPADTADFLTKEFGLQAPYARRGIDYYTKNKVYPINGDVTLAGLKVNIAVQAQDGIIKGSLPPPEKYIDLSYLR